MNIKFLITSITFCQLLSFSELLSNEKTIKIGISGNFSKASSTTNNQWRFIYQAVEFAYQDYKSELDKLKISIKFIKLDYQDNVEKVVQTAKDAHKNDVIAVIGYSQSEHAQIAAKYLNALKIVMITHTATEDTITVNRDYIFRVCFTNGSAVKKFSTFVLKKQNITRMITVYDINCLYCKDLNDRFIDEYREIGGKLESKYTSDELPKVIDFLREYSGKTDNEKIGVFIPNHERLSAEIIKKISDIQKSNIIYLGGDGWGNIGEMFFKILKGREIEGYNYTHWIPSMINENFKNKKITKLLRDKPIDSTALMYDAVSLVLNGIIDTRPTSREKLKNYLQRVKNFSGITGNISMDSNGDPDKDLIIQKVSNSKFVQY